MPIDLLQDGLYLAAKKIRSILIRKYLSRRGLDYILKVTIGIYRATEGVMSMISAYNLYLGG